MAAPPPGPVVITGASTGIGRACARYLAERGHRVFAGVRNEADAAGVRADGLATLEPLTLDVADAASVAAAAAQVRRALGDEPLQGVVNNAGIAVAGPQEFIALAEWRRLFEVNLFGALAVTQAFLPLLRARPGRIVNVGSISSRIAAPFVGPYAASKHALAAATHALRLELRPLGIHASSVDPGDVKTPIWDKTEHTARGFFDGLPDEAQVRYAGARAMADKLIANGREHGAAPEAVAKVVHHALTSRRPRPRYLVGGDAKIAWFLRWLLPDRTFDWVVRKGAGLP